jgi:glucokinase
MARLAFERRAVFQPSVGIDIGGTKLLAVSVQEDGSVVPDPLQASPKSGPELVEEVLAAAERLCGGPPGSLGVGVPGLVDPTGNVRFTPNLQGVSGTSLGDRLREALPGVAVWIGNDATAACWAEHQVGAGAGYADMIMVALGTGVGGGIVSRGELLEGSNGYAGEFGHMVVDPNGPKCPCGKRGCWERFASGAGLGFLGREMAIAGEAPRVVQLAGDPESVRGEHVTIAAREGDGPATEIMARFAWWVALGLANLTNALDPEVIVLGGGLAAAGDVLLEPTRRAFVELVEAPELRQLRIVPARLGFQSGAIGAALRAARKR